MTWMVRTRRRVYQDGSGGHKDDGAEWLYLTPRTGLPNHNEDIELAVLDDRSLLIMNVEPQVDRIIVEHT